MSAAVVFYQVAIATSILIVNILFGRRAGLLAGACWLIWTLTMVFTSSLFILQVLTIGFALHGAKEFRNSVHFQKIRKALVVTTASAALLLTALAGFAIYEESRPNSTATTAYTPPPMANSAEQPSNTQALVFRRPQTASNYELAVQSIELRYPQLNPFSEHFNAALVEQVVARRDRLVGQGVGIERAVVLAAEQVIGNRSGVYKCSTGVYQDFPCNERR